MRTFQSHIPRIVDLQPLPANATLILPKWILYLFIFAYLCAFAGLFMLLKESYSAVRLYQETVQARRITEDTVHHITDLQAKLTEAKNVQKNYESFKLRQLHNPRPGPIFNWIPGLIPKTQRATAVVLSHAGSETTLRLTIEKPVAESLVKPTSSPEGFSIKSTEEDTPRFSEIPQGKSDPNNEFVTEIFVLTKDQPK